MQWRSQTYNPVTVTRWKREFLENGPAVFGEDAAFAGYEKRIKEMEQLLGRKEVEIALLQNFTDGSSEPRRGSRS
jgi:transposase